MTEANTHNAAYERGDPEPKEHGQPYSREMRQILAQWRECKPFWDRVYKVARRDKRFLQGKQWDPGVYKERTKRGLATVTWPLIRNFYNHHLGQAIPGSVDFILTNTDPNPSNDNNQEEDAAVSVLNGHIRHIDKESKAGIHRSKARKDQFSGGVGWLGVDYVATDDPSDGQIRITSPKYFDKVMIDPYSVEPDASDATYSFYLTKMPYEVAVGKYGNKIKTIQEKEGGVFEFDDYDECRQKVSTIDHCSCGDWMVDKTHEIVIAIHHWRRKVERSFYLVADEQYTADQWRDYKNELKENGLEPPEYERKRVTGWMVEQRTICGWSVLEEKEFFINKIPWTPVLGYTMEDGEEYTFHGVAHDGINIQEHINWLASQHAKKTSDAKTLALIEHGVLDDYGFKELGEFGGIKFLGVDSQSNVDGAGGAQVITSPDDGTKELASMQFGMELLRQVTSVANDSNQNQVINSAQQLAIHISDRDAVREELDSNYRFALESHYSKVVEMIGSVNSHNELVRVVDMEEGEERVGAKQIKTGGLYSVSVRMSPSGAAQRQQAQQFAAMLMNSPDPARVQMGLMMSVDNSEISNKRQIQRMLWMMQIKTGDLSGIPRAVLTELMTEMEQTGQLQSVLQQMAEPVAQQRLQQMLSDAAIQAQFAQIQAGTDKAGLDAQRAAMSLEKAAVDADRAVRTDQLQVQQQIEQTQQDELRTLREVYRLQQEIQQTQQKGMELDEKLIERLMAIRIPQTVMIGSVP